MITFITDFTGRHAGERHAAFMKQLTDDGNFVSIKSEKFAG